MKKGFVRTASFILMCAVMLSAGLTLASCSQPDNRPEWEKRWSAVFEENEEAEYICISGKNDLLYVGLYGSFWNVIGPDDTQLTPTLGWVNDAKKEHILTFFRNGKFEFEKTDEKINYEQVYCCIDVVIDSTLYRDSEGNLSHDELGFECKRFKFYIYSDGYVYIPAGEEVYKSQDAINTDELDVFD